MVSSFMGQGQHLAELRRMVSVLSNYSCSLTYRSLLSMELSGYQEATSRQTKTVSTSYTAMHASISHL